MLSVSNDHRTVSAVLELPSGETFRAAVKLGDLSDMFKRMLTGEDEISGMELDRLCGDDDELAGWLSRAMKKVKKNIVGKIVLAPVLLAHKITHTGPIEKLHRKVQEAVGKALPFTKPFIRIHNKMSEPVARALEGKKQKALKSQLTAKAIKDAVKELPVKDRDVAVKALALRAKADEHVVSVAKGLVKRKVIAQAKKKLATNPLARQVLMTAQASKAVANGDFVVAVPDGRGAYKSVIVPRSKVPTKK